LNRAIDKLAAQGVIAFDGDGRVRGISAHDHMGRWRPEYEAQREHRRVQLDDMVVFAETAQCRMSALVRHFGDKPGLPCGQCDFCSPETAVAVPFVQPEPQQARQLRRMVRALQEGGARSAGRLQAECGEGSDRRVFDALLDGLSRAGVVTVAKEAWTNPEGKEITFRKVSLTQEGRSWSEADPLPVLLRMPSMGADRAAASPKKRSTTKSSGAASKKISQSAAFTPEQTELESRLRAWRKAEAAVMGKPAFLVLADAVLRGVAETGPRTLAQLESIHGIGPAKVERYGAAIVAICRGDNPPESFA
jgi:ATP-dependent DNA helicase RecQ